MVTNARHKIEQLTTETTLQNMLYDLTLYI